MSYNARNLHPADQHVRNASLMIYVPCRRSSGEVTAIVLAELNAGRITRVSIWDLPRCGKNGAAPARYACARGMQNWNGGVVGARMSGAGAKAMRAGCSKAPIRASTLVRALRRSCWVRSAYCIQRRWTRVHDFRIAGGKGGAAVLCEHCSSCKEPVDVCGEAKNGACTRDKACTGAWSGEIGGERRLGGATGNGVGISGKARSGANWCFAQKKMHRPH